MFMQTKPGEQVLVIPDWVYRTLAKKGQIEDLVNFSKMRQWFTQEQLVAMECFSKQGLSIFWTGGTLPRPGDPNDRYARALSYTWFFPKETGQSEITDPKDQFVRSQISTLSDNRAYSEKLVQQYILDPFKDAPADKIDLNQSYSVYSASDKLIVVALNQGVLSPVLSSRKEELRLSILRGVVEKLQSYYELHVVHQTQWFEWYLHELDRLK